MFAVSAVLHCFVVFFSFVSPCNHFTECNGTTDKEEVDSRSIQHHRATMYVCVYCQQSSVKSCAVSKDCTSSLTGEYDGSVGELGGVSSSLR